MDKDLTTDELEALRYIQWVEPIATLIDLSYGSCDLSQGSTQAWWDSISPIPYKGDIMTEMTELQNFSTDELKAEIERRKVSAENPKPAILDAISWHSLIAICQVYLDETWDNEYVNEDLPHYIFETAMLCVFGEAVFVKINQHRRK